MGSPSYSYVANGNISPSRAVKYDTTAGVLDRVLQAGAGDKVIAVSQMGVRYAPWTPLDDGFAAIAGENVACYGPPDRNVVLELGGTVVQGDSLKSDTNGKGVTTTSTGDWVFAIAMEPGNAGDLIRVELIDPAQY